VVVYFHVKAGSLINCILFIILFLNYSLYLQTCKKTVVCKFIIRGANYL